MPKKIGIRFGDNDFHGTFFPFLKAIGDYGIDEYEFTKEKFVKLAHKTIGAFYWLCDNRLEYDDHDAENYIKEKINIDRIYFDDEVDEFILIHSGSYNGEFFVLDTDNWNRTPFVYSV